MLIINKRRMINGSIFGSIELNVRQCIFDKKQLTSCGVDYLSCSFSVMTINCCALKRLEQLKVTPNKIRQANTVCQRNHPQVIFSNTRVNNYSLKTRPRIYLCSTKTTVSKTSNFKLYWSGYVCAKPVHSRGNYLSTCG